MFLIGSIQWQTERGKKNKRLLSIIKTDRNKYSVEKKNWKKWEKIFQKNNGKGYVVRMQYQHLDDIFSVPKWNIVSHSLANL